MSMLKKIKSLFIVEEELKDSKIKSDDQGKSRSGDNDNPEVVIDTDNASVTKASLDQFLKVLASAMESNNQEGYDYLEFKQALRSLDKIESDETKRFITSYTLAKTMGAEKIKLLESGNFYLDILKKEEDKFNDSLQKQIESKLQNRKQSLLNLKEKKIKKEEQIKKLKEEILGIDKKIVGVMKEIESSTNKVASVQKSFHTAYELIVNQIKDDLGKIEKYIK